MPDLSFCCRIHDDSQPYQCTACKESFVLPRRFEKSCFWNHKKGYELGTLKCLNCSLEFNQYDLELHNLTCDIKLGEENLKQFKCDLCEMTFATKKYLSKHIFYNS